ncbi:MAG: hypothetical protein WD740_03805 [Anaerolineales bacterium]
MQRTFLALIAVTLTLAACAPPEAGPLDIEARVALPTPFLMAGGVFIGEPQHFLLQSEELGGEYQADGAGSASPNSGVLEGRADGAAYLEATGRLSGWRMQYNASGEGQAPPYIVNVVNIYETAEGAQLVLSRDWHQDVWSLIDSGDLTQLPAITGLDTEHLVWQTADGAVGVEMIYRNLYIFFTGPGDNSDPLPRLAQLAIAHLEWIKAGEQ